MDADEREIFDYLQTMAGNWVSAAEICRRAGERRRFKEDNEWAKPILLRMKEQKILESDPFGRFRIKPAPRHGGKKHWISPEIEKILRESGVKVDAERADAASGSDPRQL